MGRIKWFCCAPLMVVLFFFAFSNASEAYETREYWKQKVDEAIVSLNTPELQFGYTDTDNVRFLAWSAGYSVESLLRMYQVTGEPSYISTAHEWIMNMHAQMADGSQNGLKGFGSSDYDGRYAEYTVTDGMIIYAWAKYINTVNNDPQLREVYGAFADELLEDIIHHMLPNFDSKWNETAGVYNDEFTNVPNGIHNRYLQYAEALSMVYALAPEQTEVYKQRADRMYAKFKQILPQNTSAYRWPYANSLWDDIGHAGIVVHNALGAYSRGTVFNDADMQKFANTFVENVWNGSLQQPAFRFDVGGTSVYGTNPDALPFLYWNWMALWDRDVWNAIESYFGIYDFPNESQQLTTASLLYMMHPDAAAPQAFSLAKPMNGAVDQDSLLVLSWQPSVHASHYELQIASDSQFQSIVVSRDKIVDTNTRVEGLQSGQTYYWRVIAKNAGTIEQTSATQHFTTSSSILSFQHLDVNNANTPAGYWYKQLLIDGEVVWEEDLALQPSSVWNMEQIEISSYIRHKPAYTIAFRLMNKQAITSFQAEVYFDDIRLDGQLVENGDFSQGLASWSSAAQGNNFSSSISSQHAVSGSQSFRLFFPTATVLGAGNHVSLAQDMTTNGSEQVMTFRHQDDYSGSTSGYWHKQVLVNGRVVWEQDVSASAAGVWSEETVNLTPYIAAKEDFTVALRLVDKLGVSNFDVEVYWDDLRMNGALIANPSFESRSAWKDEKTSANFVADYTTAASAHGSQSYVMQYPSHTSGTPGHYTQISQVVGKPSGVYQLTFAHLDIYGGNAPKGYWYKQVLLDDQVIWEQDISSSNEAPDQWYYETIDITPFVLGREQLNLTLQLVSKEGVSSFGGRVYWDDVQLNGTALNGDQIIKNGDFEQSASWLYDSNNGNFTGQYQTDERYQGSRAYMLSYPTGQPSASGSYANISQSVNLYTMSFWHRDNRSGSTLSSFWLKQVRIGERIAWSRDIADNQEDAAVWYGEIIDITPYVSDASVFDLHMQLYARHSVDNYSAEVHWDDVYIHGIDLPGGGMETNTDWNFTRNATPFNGSFVSDVYQAGMRSYRIAFPGSTSSSIGHYGRVSQSLSK